MSRSVTLAIFIPLALAAAQTRFSVEAASAYGFKKDYKGGLAYALAWTRAEPNNATAWYYAGNFYGSKTYHMGLEQPAGAFDAYRHAVQLNPAYAEAWNGLGFSAQEIRRSKDAIEAWKHATELKPDRPNYWGSLASAYVDENRLAEARAAVDNMERATQTSTSYVQWYNLGNDLMALPGMRSGLQRAAAAYKRSIELNSNYGDAWNNWGIVEENIGNVQGALNDYQRAFRLGDALGGKNYSRLQEAIRATQTQQSRPRIVCSLECMHNDQVRRWQDNHPGQNYYAH